MTEFLTNTNVLILIWLTSLSSKGYCRIANNDLELHCNITTPAQDVSGTLNVTRQISAVNKCPENYNNEDIIKKCENLIDSKLPGSETLFKPVVNIHRNVTYWNEYCAACNEESNLEYWSSWKNYSDDLKLFCMSYKLEGQTSRTDKNPHEFSLHYIRKNVLLESKYNQSTSQMQCTMEENWPLNLVHFVSPCMADDFQVDRNKRLDSCQYIKNDGTVCREMKFIVEGLDFIFGENGQIDLTNTSSGRGIAIDGKYVLQSGINNVIYLCKPDKEKYEIWFYIGTNSIIMSVIFLTVYLIINFNKGYFQSFPNRILYSYAVGLTITYVLNYFIFLIFDRSCIRILLNYFSLLFNFFWTMILNLEFCRLTYCTLRKRRVSARAQHKRFIVYCFIGFGLPTILPVVYFSLLLYGNHCLPISGYFAMPCKAVTHSVTEFFWNWVVNWYRWGFLYLIPALFLLQACVLIYITKCGSNRIRSTANRSNFVILMKMSFFMGACWALFDFCLMLVDSAGAQYYVKNVYDILDSLQGVILFFAFGVHKKILSKVWKKNDCKYETTEATEVTEAVSSVTNCA